MPEDEPLNTLDRRSFLISASAGGTMTYLESALARTPSGPPTKAPVSTNEERRAQEPSRTSAKRPNFLIFMTDQLNPNCLGYAGHPMVRTPNIDKLASEGANFARTYVAHPLCAPSRASLFTGLTTRGHHVRMNGMIALSPEIPTITEALRQSGYSTYCAGKVHLGIGLTPNGVNVDSLKVEDYPEGWEFWRTGKIKNLPSPYYGLEKIDYAASHGPYNYGNYNQWLAKEHPKENKLFNDTIAELESEVDSRERIARVALETPSPAFKLFNRESFKWALPNELHPYTWIADRTIDFLKDAGKQRAQAIQNAKSPKPFFVWCSIEGPHPPFAPTKPYCYNYDPKEVPPPHRKEGEFDRLPPHFRLMYETALTTSGNKGQAMKLTTPYRSECAAHYYGLIEMLDHQIGRVLESLRVNGLEEDTVVMFITDHGEALGDHWMWGKGPYHFDGVIRAPFLIKWPGHIEPGVKHSEVTSYLDFAPTVLDMANVPIPQGYLPPVIEAPAMPAPWPGRSLLPLLRGEPTEPTTALVEQDEDYLGFRMRTLVTQRYRLTAYSGKPYGELFDLQEDPHEFNNLWDDLNSKKIRDELRIMLLDKIMSTDNPMPRQVARS